MEQCLMASEKRSDQLAAPDLENLKVSRLPPPPPPQSRPPISNDGPESLRSSDC
jgi:hypothetical protein